ncbi:MAG TPA: Holliday junction branch migration protein RuvA [Burkholderiales bacterium]|nr:Holliday junction branch migration protein RuvA [Burkholderiales bacterium]
MIGRIKGDLIYIKPPQVLIDVSGIGYEIDLPMSDCSDLTSIGSQITLFTHLVIREDAHSLYGFLTVQKRDCFRNLIKVSGIGPRIALALLSTLTIDELSVALQIGDISTLCKTPGIGKKMAERMLLELKGKFNLPNMQFMGVNQEDVVKGQGNNIKFDVINALNSLGYNDKEIYQVMKNLKEDIVDVSHGIKEALKLLAR